MIDISTYRSRIGLFGQKPKNVSFKNLQQFQSTSYSYRCGQATFGTTKSIMKIILLFSLLYPTCYSSSQYPCLPPTPCTRLPAPSSQTSAGLSCQVRVSPQQLQYYRKYGKKQTANFLSRYINGNIAPSPRGIKNSHLNIRSLAKKVFEVKNIIELLMFWDCLKLN